MRWLWMSSSVDMEILVDDVVTFYVAGRWHCRVVVSGSCDLAPQVRRQHVI